MTNLVRRTPALVGIVSLGLLPISAGSAENSISIDCPIEIEVPTRDTVVEIPVYFTTDTPWSEFMVVLSHDSGGIDSMGVSLVGSQVPCREWLQAASYPRQRTVLIGWAHIPFHTCFLIDIEKDLMATLLLYIPAGARPQLIDIDSTNVLPFGDFYFSGHGIDHGRLGYHDCGEGELRIVGGDCGDVNLDSEINLTDALYLLEYIFGGGTVPRDVSGGDVNQDGRLNLGDAVYLIAHIFYGGPEPCGA